MDAEATLYSPTTEEAVIGAVLIYPDGYDQVSLDPEQFYVHKLRFIWQAIQAVASAGHAIDMLSVAQQLDRMGKLGECGGSAYLTSLINLVPSSLHIRTYAATVRELWSRRQVVQIANQLAASALDKDSPMDETIAGLMTTLSMSTNVNRGAVNWGMYLEQVQAEALDRAEDPDKIWGLQTGFADFDEITGGLQPSELLLITAPSGVGKSLLLAQMGKQLAELAGPGAIYSLEMCGAAFVRRIVSGTSRIRTRTIKSGIGWTDHEWDAFNTAMQTLGNLPVYMTDASGWTTTGLRSDLARLKRTERIQWFLVDYTLMLSDGADTLNETERTALIVNRLKSISKSLNLAGVAIHPQNKLGQLRGSAQVKYDADLVLSINPDDVEKNLIHCQFEKARELENDLLYFNLVRLPGLPWYGNSTTIKTEILNKSI